MNNFVKPLLILLVVFLSAGNAHASFYDDNDFDGADLALFASAFDSKAGDPHYDLAADFAHDGDVDSNDLQFFSAEFGSSNCFPPEIATEIGSDGGTIEVVESTSQIVGTRLLIPPQSVDQPVPITVSNGSSDGFPSSSFLLIAPVVKLGPDGVTFSKEIELFVPYPDTDNDGIIDGTGVEEEKLFVLAREASDDEWHIIPKIGQDNLSNTITILTSHFSEYTVTTEDIINEFADEFDEDICKDESFYMRSDDLKHNNLCGTSLDLIKTEYSYLKLTYPSGRETVGPDGASEADTRKFFQYGTFLAKFKAAPHKNLPKGNIISAFFTYRNEKLDEYEKIGMTDNHEIDFEIYSGRPNEVQIMVWRDYDSETNYLYREKPNRIGWKIDLTTGHIQRTKNRYEFGGWEDIIEDKSDTIPGFNATDNFYIYGFRWEPVSIEFFMIHDGRKVRLLTYCPDRPDLFIPSLPQHIIFNTWREKDSAVATDDHTMEVDFVYYGEDEDRDGWPDHVDDCPSIYDPDQNLNQCASVLVLQEEFLEDSLNGWTAKDLFYGLQGNTAYVYEGYYTAGDGTQLGGHHKELDQEISGTSFMIEFRSRSRNKYGVGAINVGLLVDTTVYDNPFGGKSANGYFVAVGSYQGRVIVFKMEKGQYTLLAQTTKGGFPQDENFHIVRVYHLSSGSWSIFVDGKEQTLETAKKDMSFTNFRFISLGLDPNDGTTTNALDDIYVYDTD
ncbi:MAG: hypothetical protein DRH12_07775 [Deltaproteobacteria bacterium]|nr:MAG: hypothetical protein DRH12_07775 [Deltaproteobacteria bacterium]